MQYVSVNSSVDSLEREVESWERKLEVAVGAEKVMRRQVREIQNGTQ